MFARLLNQHGAVMVESLASVGVADPKQGGAAVDGMTLLCRVWTDSQKQFRGKYQVKVTLLALAQLLLLQNATVNAIQVEQDVVKIIRGPGGGDGRVSRSQARAAREQGGEGKGEAEGPTVVTFPVRVFTLLAQSLDVSSKDDDEAGFFGFGGSDDDEWDSEDGEDGGGGGGGEVGGGGASPFVSAEDYGFQLSDMLGGGGGGGGGDGGGGGGYEAFEAFMYGGMDTGEAGEEDEGEEDLDFKQDPLFE